MRLDSDALRALVRANVRALGALLAEPALAADLLRRLMPTVDDAGARAFYDRYVAPWFRADGLADPEVVARALPAVASELRASGGVTDVHIPQFGEVYRTDLTAEWTR
jgi:hypothetical protein